MRSPPAPTGTASASASAPRATRRRLRLGHVLVDELTFAGALDAIEALVAARRGGTVFTPNVDHVVLAEEDERFRRAYAAASLSLVDGMPVLWASRLLGVPLPEKISGSDLFVPLVERAAARGHRVYFLGGADGVAEKAAAALTARFPRLVVAGWSSPRIDLADVRAPAVVDPVKAANADLVFVCLGAPKQEIWSHENADALAPAVCLGVGAAIDFVAGSVQRAPAWMSGAGLEWAYRLAREPRRMWKRYLVRDPKFLAVLARALATPAERRVVHVPA